MSGFLRSLPSTGTFFTKSMFGGLAAYLFGRQMLLLVEPTISGRWDWHGVLICTGFEHHASLRAEFPALLPHEFFEKMALHRLEAREF